MYSSWIDGKRETDNTGSSRLIGESTIRTAVTSASLEVRSRTRLGSAELVTVNIALLKSCASCAASRI